MRSEGAGKTSHFMTGHRTVLTVSATSLWSKTIAKKVKNGYPPDILIETSQLRNSLQWMIVSKKAYGTNRKVIGNVSDETVKIVLKQDFNGE